MLDSVDFSETGLVFGMVVFEDCCAEIIVTFILDGAEFVISADNDDFDDSF